MQTGPKKKKKKKSSVWTYVRIRTRSIGAICSFRGRNATNRFLPRRKLRSRDSAASLSIRVALLLIKVHNCAQLPTWWWRQGPVRSGTKAVCPQAPVTDHSPFAATAKKRKATLPWGYVSFVDLASWPASVFAVTHFRTFLWSYNNRSKRKNSIKIVQRRIYYVSLL
jgi:hypothetical protein